MLWLLMYGVGKNGGGEKTVRQLTQDICVGGLLSVDTLTDTLSMGGAM